MRSNLSQIEVERSNRLINHMNQTIAMLSKEIALFEMNGCDDIYSHMSGDGFQIKKTRLSEGKPITLHLGANLSPIRQSDTLIFSGGTLNFSIGDNRVLSIRVHKFSYKCTISVTKSFDTRSSSDMVIVRDVLRSYIISLGISNSSRLWELLNEYAFSVSELFGIVGFYG